MAGEDAQHMVHDITARGYQITIDVHGTSSVQVSVWAEPLTDGMQPMVAGATGRNLTAALRKAITTLRKLRKKPRK